MLTRRQLAALPLAAAAPARRRPDIVLFLADDLGSADLSSYGAPDIRTPNIDRIGEHGVRFTQCYSNGPECSPTRTALLTGRYQQRVGGLECAIGVGNVGRYDEAVWLQQRGELGLPATEITLPRILKDAGYDTGCFGKWHLGYLPKFLPRRHGFDEYFGILGGNADYFTHREEDGRLTLYQNESPVERRGHSTDLFADEAIAWLKRRTDKPYFLYLPFTAPHTPIQDPAGMDSKTGTAPWRNRERPVYAKMVEHMDARIATVLDQVRKLGREENTIVLFLSDNGADPNGNNGALRGRKSSLWEGGIRVPCLMRWPARLKAGGTVRQLAMTMDLTPTLLGAAGAAARAKFDGVDLMPSLTGKRPDFARTVFWRYKRAQERRKCVREGDLKLVIDGAQEELHDLAADGREERNLLAERKTEADALRKKLDAWERDVQAPRLSGFRPV
ncbi:MAG: sulfatase-like hydrolase/transferase [Bryobacteraceae bacterium]